MPFGKKKIEKAFIHLRNLTKSKGSDTQNNTEDKLEEVTTSLTESDWFTAVKGQDVNKVKEIIDSGKIDVNDPDEFGWPALHLCAWNHFSDITVILIEAHCDVNKSGPNNSTALSLACQKGHIDIVNMLLIARCDVDKTSNLGANQDVSPLHLASQNGHVDIVKLLLQSGVSTNVCMRTGGIRGVTPLHLAVEAGHMDVMDLLIEAGCDVQSSTKPNTETHC